MFSCLMRAYWNCLHMCHMFAYVSTNKGPRYIINVFYSLWSTAGVFFVYIVFGTLWSMSSIDASVDKIVYVYWCLILIFTHTLGIWSSALHEWQVDDSKEMCPQIVAKRVLFLFVLYVCIPAHMKVISANNANLTNKNKKTRFTIHTYNAYIRLYFLQNNFST